MKVSMAARQYKRHFILLRANHIPECQLISLPRWLKRNVSSAVNWSRFANSKVAKMSAGHARHLHLIWKGSVSSEWYWKNGSSLRKLFLYSAECSIYLFLVLLPSSSFSLLQCFQCDPRKTSPCTQPQVVNHLKQSISLLRSSLAH